MKAPLYRYQADAVAQLRTGAPTYLGFDPGLGKSRTALEAARVRGDKRILVIAPASGRYVWQSECAKWLPEMPFHMVSGIKDLGKLTNNGIVMITYGLLSIKD